MITKKMVRTAMRKMPEKFPIEDILDRLLLIQKIENGMRQAKRGEGFTTQEIKREIKKWSK